jgi:ABC-type sugar transport system substrate-binding protein
MLPPRPRVAPFAASLCALLATACGDPAPPAGSGGIQIAQSVAADWSPAAAAAALTNALAAGTPIAAVFAHDDAMAAAAVGACRAAGRTEVKAVGIGGLADEGQRLLGAGDLDATVVAPTGAAAAIDFALLAVQGAAPPPRLLLGPRILTKANLAAGGLQVPSPGEFMLQALRHQHRDILTTTPTIDVVFRIALVQFDDRPARQASLRDEAVAHAARYPQIHFAHHGANGDAARLAAVLEQQIAQNCNAMLVVAPAHNAVVAACTRAVGLGIRVLTVDDELPAAACTSFLGVDEDALGRAAAAALRMLLPQGGAIVEVQGTMTDRRAQLRHEGFVQALAREKP